MSNKCSSFPHLSSSFSLLATCKSSTSSPPPPVRKSDSSDWSKWALSPLNSSYFCHWPSNIPLTVFLFCTSMSSCAMNYLGATKVFHQFCTHSNSYFHLLALMTVTSLALLCSSLSEPAPQSSSVIASIPSPPWAFISVWCAQTQHPFLLFFCSLPPLSYSPPSLPRISPSVNYKFPCTQWLHSSTVALSCCLPPSCCVSHAFFESMRVR